MTNQEIKNYYDLYDYELIVTALQRKYMFVSYCKKSIPKQGSQTVTTKRINTKTDAKILKVINHRNEDKITLKTTYGFLQFFTT